MDANKDQPLANAETKKEEKTAVVKKEQAELTDTKKVAEQTTVETQTTWENGVEHTATDNYAVTMPSRPIIDVQRATPLYQQFLRWSGRGISEDDFSSDE